MPLLGGLFGRKHKAAPAHPVAPSDAGSALSSPTNSYVTTDKSLPSSPNGRSSLSTASPNHHHYQSSSPAMSSKLRLPFSRKKSRAPVQDPSPRLLLHPPRPHHLSTSAAYDSDSGATRPLSPPPPKSAMLAAYTDPSSALSTRSLPIASPSHRQHKEKRPSFFPWTKDSASSKPLPDPKRSVNLNAPLPPESDSSFNLKSFRHLRPPSPTASNSSLAVPPSRPRNSSVHSESSQRISVAAFREAHARRSAAGSPSPSFRSPSPPSPFPLDAQRGRTNSRPTSQAINQRRSTNLAVGYTSDSDESASSEEEDSDDGLHPHRRNGATRNRVVRPQVGKRQARSEIGHAGSGHPAKPQSTFTATQSHNGHGDLDQNVRQSSVGNTPNSPIEQASRSRSDLAVNGARRRGSNSTSALSPSAAAKRASVLANANVALDQEPLVALRQTSRHVRDSSTVSNPSQVAKALKKSVETDSESEEDNAPLACLVPPRRPGSSMSSASNASLKTNGTRGPNGRAMSKPLIDINQLTSKKPTIGTQKNNDDAFTGSGLIVGQMHGSPNALVTSPTLIDTPSSYSPLTSTSPPSGSTHFIPPLSPSKEMKAYFNLDNKLSSSPPSISKVEKSPSPERRRDVLTERLAKLAKANMNQMDEPSAKLKKKSQSPPPPQRQAPTRPELTLERTTQPIVNSKPSPPDDQLMQDVDYDILKLISRMGESEEIEMPQASTKLEESEMSSDSESDAYDESDHNRPQQDANEKSLPKFPLRPGLESEDKNRIAPIPIRQRAPAPSFSVMSRPPILRPQDDDNRSSLASTTLGSSSARGSANPDSATSTATNAKVVLNNETSSTSLASTLSTSQPIPSSTVTQRQRSSTMIPSSSPPSSFGPSTSSFAKLAAREGSSSTHTPSSASVGSPSSLPKTPNVNKATALRSATGTNVDSLSSRDVHSPLMNSSPASRHRSSTMGSIMPDQALGRPANLSPVPAMPVKPFAMRRDSPASSTGDSSSGRVPLTPGDGSDISSPKKVAGKGKGREEWGSGVSGLGPPSTTSGHGHGGPRRIKRRSVSFEDEIGDAAVAAAAASNAARKSRETDSDDSEARRRERRRSEAKAAIELGNVINGPGPVVSDDEDDLPANQVMNAARMSTMNPMMGMNSQMQMQFSSGPAAWGGNMSPWPQQARPQMLSPPSFMMSPPPEPNFFAAHHQAMMYAKQAYQMAVAQQAMAAAADEWERNSVMGGSVYGGGSNASVMMGSSQYGMMGMGGGMNNGWSTGSMIFPSGTQSAYGGRGGMGSSRSEYGGGGSPGGGQGRWSSARSSYGESFGPSDRLRPGMVAGGGGNRHSGVVRDSGYYPPVPPIPQNSRGGKSSSPGKTRNRTTSGPAVAVREGQRKPPPSSWRAGA